MRPALPAPAVPFGASGLVDTHVHLWDPGKGYGWLDARSPLHRVFGVSDLSDAIGGNPCTTTVILVEADRGDAGEAADLLRTASENPMIGGAVIGADLRTTAGADLLRRLLDSDDHRALLGIRQSVTNRDDITLIGAHRALLEHHGLVIELNIGWQSLDLASELALRLPGSSVVLNHCGGPPEENRSELMAPWTSGLAGIAHMGNVRVKLSGMLTRQRGPRPLTPPALYRITLDIFGARRSMLGSDWPVCLTAGSWRASIDAGWGASTADEVAFVAAETARSTYRIPVNDSRKALLA